MASSGKELELLLMEAGNELLEPPSSVDELVTLLDKVESFLSRVEQSPSQSMQNALSPSLKALIAEPLFRHPDDDVKVAVAACISEITRISAPDAPYHDDQMREVFQLIVSSFENLSDKSSRSYTKRTSILETVAKVRSCAVMLDLECDALIIEMFQHFLSAIRDYHADTVFTSMVTIMTLVLEESEDISMELLSPILARVKRDNEEVLPIARRLANSVLENCALKVKPYLMQAVENSGIRFEDYSSVVTSICQAAPNAVVQDDDATDKHVDIESKPAEAPLDNAFQEDKDITKESVLTEQVDHANEKSPTSVVSNVIVQTDENNSLPDSNSLKKQEDDCLADKSENLDTSTVAEPDGLEGEKVVISDSKLEQSSKEKGGKSHSKSTEPSDSTHGDGKEVETFTDQKDNSKDREDTSVDGAVSTENKRETDVQPSLTNATKDESNDVASPAPSGAVHDVSHSNKAARPKKKDGLSKEITPSVANVSKKSSEVRSDSEAKTNKRPGKKVASAVSNKDSAPADVDKTKKESGTSSDSEEKPLKQLSKKVDSSSNNADGSSSRKLEEKKKRARGKVILPEKDGTKISTRNDDEEMVGSPKAVKPNKLDSLMDGTPKTNSKRKHTQSKEKGSDTLEYDEDLVGLKVKVWWPKDRAFYDGVIQSFDPIKKKHKVCYDDGDVEILNLKREKWEVIKDESGSDEEVAADHPSLDGSSEMSEKKKAKSADQPIKKARMDVSPKRSGGASSGKSKGAATKSGSKIKEDGKVDGSKSVGKSDNVSKPKGHTPKSGSRSVGVASKVGGKSKTEDSVDTPKSIKPKDDDNVTPKAATIVKSTKPKDDDSVTPKATTIVKSTKPKDDDNVTPKATTIVKFTKPKDDDSVTPKAITIVKSTKPKDDDNVTPKATTIVNSTEPKDDDDVTPKATTIVKPTKPKDDDNVTPKATTKPKQDGTKTAKSKQETPKVSSNSKGKPLKTGGKSDANGGAKSKSGSSKAKESESMKERSVDSAEVVETLKRKAPNSPKGQGNDPKSVKKRREEPKATSTAES
ncbi:hypothetical protein V6N13_081344 [Hibiscus sabdariffa]|uniref:Uncharacterized protein n=1 Tax=Hibiscus sabdariffa TaxID=183260 RepID=A0ABR2DCU4_9ROSI